MSTYFVETYRPPFPEGGIKHRVHSHKEYSTDVLAPGMTSVFEVSGVTTKAEAVAAVIEHAAGYDVRVSRIFGNRPLASR